MPRKTKGRNGQAIDKRIVLLVEADLESGYAEMMANIKENQSEHIRNTMWTELELYRAAKK